MTFDDVSSSTGALAYLKRRMGETQATVMVRLVRDAVDLTADAVPAVTAGLKAHDQMLKRLRDLTPIQEKIREATTAFVKSVAAAGPNWLRSHDDQAAVLVQLSRSYESNAAVLRRFVRDLKQDLRSQERIAIALKATASAPKLGVSVEVDDLIALEIVLQHERRLVAGLRVGRERRRQTGAEALKQRRRDWVGLLKRNGMALAGEKDRETGA